jgi:Zinc finger, C2H2 type
MLKYFVDKQYNMTTGNEVNDVNSPVQTQESEMGDAELQVDANRVDAGEKSDESSTNVAASFSCEECGKTFATRQELKEHTQVH